MPRATHRILYISDILRNILKLQAFNVVFLYFTTQTINQPPTFRGIFTCGLVLDSVCYQRAWKSSKIKDSWGKYLTIISIWLLVQFFIFFTLNQKRGKAKATLSKVSPIFPLFLNAVWLIYWSLNKVSNLVRAMVELCLQKKTSFHYSILHRTQCLKQNVEELFWFKWWKESLNSLASISCAEISMDSWSSWGTAWKLLG